MAMGAAVDANKLLHRRTMDKHNAYLPYLREIGAMAVLVMVLYGVWDVIKVEGQLAVGAIEENTAAIHGLTAIQDKLLIHLNRVEATHAIYGSQLNYKEQIMRKFPGLEFIAIPDNVDN